MCPPVYVDTAVNNNPWMKEEQEPLDKERLLAQWYDFYNRLASCSFVYPIPPERGLQDQTYVNCAVFLPHIKKEDRIILSNFTAEGRAGEEWVGNKLFTALGFKTEQSPFKFEGEPELKYLRDNLYLGGWGIRTDKRTHGWLRSKYGCEIITIHETDPKLYHLDCLALPLGRDNLMLCVDLISREETNKIEKVTNILPVSKKAAYMGITNSLKVGDVVFNSSDLQFKNKDADDYLDERKKNDELEKICSRLGLELIYCDLSECEKSGAYLSCFVMHLNWRDE
jgi:N-dimethylarginine dimethylaminohydrolase